MRAIVCGGRDFEDWALLSRKLDELALTFVMEGGARGADALARRWALDRLGPTGHRCFPADWASLGKSAGHARNQEMLVVGRPDLVVAFPGGRGTADMVHRARANGTRVIECGK